MRRSDLQAGLFGQPDSKPCCANLRARGFQLDAERRNHSFHGLDAREWISPRALGYVLGTDDALFVGMPTNKASSVPSTYPNARGEIHSRASSPWKEWFRRSASS